MVVLVSGGGCRKSEPVSPAPAPVVSAETVARLHWLGMQRLARETNAAYFMGVWNLPESQQLAAQTLDKLALALTGEQPGGGSRQSSVSSNQLSVAGDQSSVTSNQLSAASSSVAVTNLLSPNNSPLAAKLRLLLEDLLQSESYVELRQPTNQPGELALAIRIGEQRAELWTSNLTAVLGAMTNVQSLPAPANWYAWRLPFVPPPSRLDLTRVGEWTLLGVATETNGLLAELSYRIRAEHTPVSGTGNGSSFETRPVTRKVHPASGSPAATNYWLDADLDLGRLGGALGLNRELTAGLPKLSVAVTGTGGEVRTVGELKFAKPLPFEEVAWNIPTNLIYQRLISFTAIRGFQPWLSSLKAWKGLELGAAPNQVFCWAREGLPFLSYGAVPLADASNCVARLTERLTNEGNAWMTTNGLGKFLRSETTNGLVLSVPFMEPYLEAVTVGGSDYVLGGLVRQEPGTNSLAPPELFHEVTRRTNLVAYDWELTGPRLNAWVLTGELLRLYTFRNRLPPECDSIKWVRAAAPKLGNCATAVTRTAPDGLSFVRRSSIGLTSVELHLLADWLESPQFPRGFHSQAVHRPVLPAVITSGTNSVPVTHPR